jgi:hypothetical protein
LRVGEGKNRFMRMKLFFLAGTLFAIIGRVEAGSIDLAPKETAPPSIVMHGPQITTGITF